MSKQHLFLTEIAFKHLPEFQDKVLQHHYLKLVGSYPKTFNVEHLAELALAKLGNYPHVDAKYYDFKDTDLTDCKTVSTTRTNRIYLSGIDKKIGSLRIVIYNASENRLDYMYIPFQEWKKLAKKCFGQNTSGKTRLMMSWSPEKKSYNMYDIYRISSFEELANMSDSKFYQKYPGMIVDDYSVAAVTASEVLTPSVE